MGFVVDKVTLRRVYSEYFGFPADYDSTNCSTPIILVTIVQSWYNVSTSDPMYEVRLSLTPLHT
jgi:hypothetical protein